MKCLSRAASHITYLGMPKQLSNNDVLTVCLNMLSVDVIQLCKWASWVTLSENCA